MAFEDWFIAHARVASRKHRRTTLDDKVALFQQLATLVNSGTPLLEAIQIAGQQSQSMVLGEVMEDVAGCVAAGSSLHAALANHPDVFEPHWTGIIQMGEIAGTLGPVLLDLNRQVSQYRDTRRKLVGALIYPITLIVIAIAAIGVMLWLVVPTFAEMFADMGAELPAITQVVVGASDGLVQYGPFLVGGVVLLVFLARRCLRSDVGRRKVGAVCMATPLVGPLMIEAAMYRFASHTALLLKSGVPLLESLQTLQGVFDRNPIYREAIGSMEERVAGGCSLADSMESTGLFASMLTNMVRIGEESGQLAGIMEQVAPYYKERMEAMIGRVTKLLEPAIIVVMGITIATVMMSIYLPMFEMSGKVQ